MRVVEIFESIDGEGIRAGYPVIFVRFYGCNLNCSYCDSRYACENSNFTDLSISEILLKIKHFSPKRVTLTGGEPLIQDDIKELISTLLELDYEVNVETNGAVDVSEYVSKKNLILTVDYKCPSSGMTSQMLLSNYEKLGSKDVIKFVVGSRQDLNDAEYLIKKYNLAVKSNVFLSPVFGKIEPKEIVKYILDNDLNDVRIQLQLHKFIWDPEMRGV